MTQDDFCTESIEKNCMCDANALRIIATKMQHSHVENVIFVNQHGVRYILVRYY